MAYEIPNFYVGVFPADIDMSTESTWQYAGVGVYTALSVTGTGIGGAALCAVSSASNGMIGVLQNNPKQAEAGQVMVQGVTKAKASGTFNPGDFLYAVGGGTFAQWTSV